MKYDNCFEYRNNILVRNRNAVDVRDAELGDIFKAEYQMKFRPNITEYTITRDDEEIDIIVGYENDSCGGEAIAYVFNTAFDYDGNTVQLTDREAMEASDYVAKQLYDASR